jgi:hypothetical protein
VRDGSIFACFTIFAKRILLKDRIAGHRTEQAREFRFSEWLVSGFLAEIEAAGGPDRANRAGKLIPPGTPLLFASRKCDP